MRKVFTLRAEHFAEFAGIRRIPEDIENQGVGAKRPGLRQLARVIPGQVSMF